MSKKILVAEDSSVIQNLTKKILRQQNYEIATVKNGKEVLDLLDKAAVSYQIVLTKTDKIKPPAVERAKTEISVKISKRAAAFPRVLSTSSEKNAGFAELRAEIASLI